MTKNPFINAASAIIYIVMVVSIVSFMSKQVKDGETMLMPILALSLLTLSASVMAYIFFYQPFQLYFNNKKKQAVDLFFKTVGVFAGITVLVLLLILSGLFR